MCAVEGRGNDGAAHAGQRRIGVDALGDGGVGFVQRGQKQILIIGICIGSAGLRLGKRLPHRRDQRCAGETPAHVAADAIGDDQQGVAVWPLQHRGGVLLLVAGSRDLRPGRL